MSEWTQLKTLQDVAAAQARGDEIEHRHSGKDWEPWHKASWQVDVGYRSRLRKKTKTIVLREALVELGGGYFAQWRTSEVERSSNFVKWLETPAREIEVEE